MEKISERGFGRLYSDKKYLKTVFYHRMNKKLDLENPQTFNEKLQWLKLYDRKPLYTTLVDKYAVKEHITKTIGEDYVIPCLGVWDNFEDIDFDSLPDQFVLKCTHDSGGLVICRDKSKLDYKKVQSKIRKSLKRNYYWNAREWPYKNVKPRIIAEKFINVSGKSKTPIEDSDIISCYDLQSSCGLLDYKFMCFDGVVKALFLDIGVIGSGTGHAHEYYRNIYDRNGNLLPCKETRENYPKKIKLPENLPQMVEIAEKLSKGIPHLRVDLYNLNDGNIKVGELTFYHGAGLSNKFIPYEWDYTFGSWIRLNNENS